MVKNPPANAGGTGDTGAGKILWNRTWQPTPVFLPGKPHGQRSLTGYSPWGCKESDTTEHVHTHTTHTHTHVHAHTQAEGGADPGQLGAGGVTDQEVESRS